MGGICEPDMKAEPFNGNLIRFHVNVPQAALLNEKIETTKRDKS